MLYYKVGLNQLLRSLWLLNIATNFNLLISEMDSAAQNKSDRLLSAVVCIVGRTLGGLSARVGAYRKLLAAGGEARLGPTPPLLSLTNSRLQLTNSRVEVLVRRTSFN